MRLSTLCGLSLLLIACQSTSGDDDGCDTDAECKQDRVCVDHQCVAPDNGGSGGASNGTHNASEWCQTYAQRCNDPEFDPARCITDCSQGMTSDDCWFKACAVEVGKCDDEEPNDSAIKACGVRHGWTDASGGASGAGGVGGASGTGGSGGACIPAGQVCSGSLCCSDSLCINYEAIGTYCGFICTSGSQCESGCCVPTDTGYDVCAAEQFCPGGSGGSGGGGAGSCSECVRSCLDLQLPNCCTGENCLCQSECS